MIENLETNLNQTQNHNLSIQTENLIQSNEIEKQSNNNVVVDNKKPKKKNIVFVGLFLILTFLFFIIIVSLITKKQKPIKEPIDNVSTGEILPLISPEDSSLLISCLALSFPEINQILPAEANDSNQYELRIHDYSPNKCFLAINIDYPVGQNRHQLIQNQDYPLVGLWIINTAEKKASKLVPYSQDYLFSSWLNDQMIDANGETGNTITTYNASSGVVIKKKLNKLNLIFNKNAFDQMVEFKTLKNIDYCDFKKLTENNFVQYDFECIEQSDILIKIPGYKEILLQHAANDAVRIDSVLYPNLLSKNKWNISL